LLSATNHMILKKGRDVPLQDGAWVAPAAMNEGVLRLLAECYNNNNMIMGESKGRRGLGGGVKMKEPCGCAWVVTAGFTQSFPRPMILLFGTGNWFETKRFSVARSKQQWGRTAWVYVGRQEVHQTRHISSSTHSSWGRLFHGKQRHGSVCNKKIW